jgi:hypothetical protein
MDRDLTQAPVVVGAGTELGVARLGHARQQSLATSVIFESILPTFLVFV